MKIYDERQTLFSRVRLQKGTKDYQQFYQSYPEYQSGDDAIRGMDFLNALRKSDEFKARVFPIFNENDHLTEHFYKAVETVKLKEKTPVPKDFHHNIKALMKHYGALDVGIVHLKTHHYYSHKGYNRDYPKQTYGEAIKTRYQTAIVYLVPMDEDHLKRAPHIESTLESLGAYLDIAYSGMRMATYLKQLGYRSTFQSEIYYLTPLVPLAVDAGLGEIGMHNHLMHPEYGNRVRIGAVLTDLPLKEDAPIDFGVEAFCKRCALCLMNCPMLSISFKKRMVNEKQFYKFNDQSCFKIFKNAGTDCGICIQSCPLSYNIGIARLMDAKNDPKKIDKLIQKHLNKHGRRPSIKTPLPIVGE